MRTISTSNLSCLAVLAGIVLLSLAPQPSQAQTSPVQVLERIEALEAGMKDVRGTLEEDLRALRQSLEGREGLSAQEVATLRNQLLKLGDQINALNDRLERTLEVASDNEFRLLRMEKRVESLMRMGIENSLAQTAPLAPAAPAASAAPAAPAAPAVPANTGAGTPPSSSLNATQDQSVVWTLEGATLEQELAGDNTGAVTSQSAPEQAAIPQPPEPVSVLPDVSADDQYSFALGKALQNDLEMAEQAFSEFTTLHPDHGRSADASFWLGRVQFMRGSYEKAAMTFSEFQSKWPSDARVEKTTLWIGEAVTNFAPKEEVCELLGSLPSLVPNPTESFFERLEKLKATAECSG